MPAQTLKLDNTEPLSNSHKTALIDINPHIDPAFVFRPRNFLLIPIFFKTSFHVYGPESMLLSGLKVI